LFPFDREQELLERRLEVSFIVYDECVLREEGRVERLRFEAAAVGTKEEAAADHVDCAEDDRRTGRIDAPRAIVRKLTTERAHGDGALEVRQSARLLNAERFERRPERVEPRIGDALWLEKALGFAGRLIDDGAAVHDVDEAARTVRGGAVLGALCEGEEPDRQDRCLPEPCRDIALARHVAGDQALEERDLPREWHAVRQCFELLLEFVC
jgi:hypothetical protein